VTVSVTSSDPEAPPQPSNSPAPQGVRLTSPGGSVYADCDGGKVTLSSWQAADGYTVQKVDPGPALSADIVFQRAISRYRMSVTCLGDTPTPVVLPL
jgi:serine/threonine-protein kinase